MEPERPRDIKSPSLTPITDFIEKRAAEHGHFAPVGEDYYREFLQLTQPEIEKLAVTVLLEEEREVRRLASGRSDTAAVDRVAKLVRDVFHAISMGLARFNALGRLGFVSRIGPKPWETDLAGTLERRYAEIAPMIEVSQSELPL
jgi:hypothetical protein